MIKLVALDIYRTVLCCMSEESGDCETAHKEPWEIRPRKGLAQFFDHCDSLGVPVVSTSDERNENVKEDLSKCFGRFPESGMGVDRFYDFIEMNRGGAKDFWRVISLARNVYVPRINLKPKELLVIGDSFDRDIEGARIVKAMSQKVEPYIFENDGFDFSRIDLRKYR